MIKKTKKLEDDELIKHENHQLSIILTYHLKNLKMKTIKKKRKLLENYYYNTLFLYTSLLFLSYLLSFPQSSFFLRISVPSPLFYFLSLTSPDFFSPCAFLNLLNPEQFAVTTNELFRWCKTGRWKCLTFSTASFVKFTILLSW